MKMDSSNNVKWIIPFKKFGMVRVKGSVRASEHFDKHLCKVWIYKKNKQSVFIYTFVVKLNLKLYP